MKETFKDNYPVVAEGSNSSNNYNKEESVAVLEILNNRLQLLEQESEKMKKVLVVCMVERQEIISEILPLFQTLCSETNRSISFYQETRHRRIGLLQALYEDSNPFMVKQGSTKSHIFC